MRKNNGSLALRWIAAALLAVSAYPLLRGRPVPENKPSGITAADPNWAVPGEIVVDLKDNVSSSDITSLSQKYGASFVSDEPGSPHPQLFTIKTDALLAPALLAKLRQDPLVEAAEPEHLFRVPEAEMAKANQPETPEASPESQDIPTGGWKPNDPRYAEQWNFKRIHTERAWEVTKGKGAVVAVIDTGVAFENSGRGKQARDFKETGFTAPFDFVHRDKNPYDDNGHGTHVAGTIAESTNNGEGVAGIAFEAKIMPIKVLSGSGSGRMSDVAAGIRYAADHGANIINMSLGAPFPDVITQNACRYAYQKGVTIICAAGNSGQEGVGYPAAYPYCIAVSALGPKGQLTPYSSWGAAVAISAPGGDRMFGEAGCILQNTIYDGEDGYFGFQGTSMATPHVAGVAALIVSRGIKEPAEVRSVLEKSAQPRGPKNKYGAGELDASAAVGQASAEGAGYYGRLYMLAAIWMACWFVRSSRGKSIRGSSWSTAVAVTIGLYFPDVVTAFAGYESTWNLLGHSVIVPVFLYVCEAEGRAESRFYGLFALGTSLHLLGNLWSGNAPLFGAYSWAAIPWLVVNIVIGIGTYLASRKAE
jgi:serine protease